VKGGITKKFNKKLVKKFAFPKMQFSDDLYQQQAWLETYEPMIRRRIHDRDSMIQQRLHTIDEYFPTIPAGTANR
jgi:hypothetical protein